MREPTRRWLGGVVSKYRKVGLFKYAPEDLTKQRRIAGRKGGSKSSPAKKAASRAKGLKTMRGLWADPVYREKMRWNCTPFGVRDI